MVVTQNIFCITLCGVFCMFVYCKHSYRQSPAILVPVRITVGISHNFARHPPLSKKKKKPQKNKPLWNSSIIIVETQPTRLPLGCIRWSSSSKKYKFNLACVCLCIVYLLCKYKVSEHKDKAGIYASICPDAYGAGFQLLVLHWRPEGTLPSLLCITGVFLHQAT